MLQRYAISNPWLWWNEKIQILNEMNDILIVVNDIGMQTNDNQMYRALSGCN